PAAAKTAAASVKAWCQANYVHEKTVRNVLHVRAQLRALFRQNGIVCDDDEEEEGGRGGGSKKKGLANGHANGNGKGGHVNGKGGHVNGNGMDENGNGKGVDESSSSEDESDDIAAHLLAQSDVEGDADAAPGSSSRGLYVTRKSISSMSSAVNGSRSGWKEERYEALREVLCEGRLGNIAFRQTNGSYKRIGKGQTFKIHPSSALHGRGASAIFFEELVHTTQHFARTLSMIEPIWAQTAGGGGDSDDH
ncbi:hypothetical protein A4X13_0g8577, partial [Tilletia indica]